jgi:hypothetical protein
VGTFSGILAGGLGVDFTPAFRSRLTDEIVVTPGYHDITVIDPEVSDSTVAEWEDGFVDEKGSFYTRREAAQVLMPTEKARTRARKERIDVDELESQDYAAGREKGLFGLPRRGTFAGILSGAPEHPSLRFPWAYHGTRREYLSSIAKSGLRPVKGFPEALAFHRPAGASRTKHVPVTYFAPCPAIAADYARLSKEAVLLRFPWPKDARSWTNEYERENVLARNAACATGVVPSPKPQRVHGRMVREWWWAPDFEHNPKAFCKAWAEERLGQHVTSLVVPGDGIEVFVGTITKEMARGCRENDTRFKQWIPLRDYLAGTKK